MESGNKRRRFFGEGVPADMQAGDGYATPLLQKYGWYNRERDSHAGDSPTLLQGGFRNGRIFWDFELTEAKICGMIPLVP